MITGFLVYLIIGSLIWMILDGLGVIDNTYAEKGASTQAMVLATLYMIFGWPVFIFQWLRGMVRAR